MWLVRVFRLRPLLRPGRAVLCERSRSAGLTVQQWPASPRGEVQQRATALVDVRR